MSEFTIRAAVPADLPAILSIEQENPTAAHWHQAAYRALWAEPEPWVALVAERAGSILGFAVAHGVVGEWELENIAVTPASQRQGIAQKLVQALFERLVATRAKAVFLEVRESNLPARRFYESQGFVISGRRKNYYRNPEEDALLFEKKFADLRMNIR